MAGYRGFASFVLVGALAAAAGCGQRSDHHRMALADNPATQDSRSDLASSVPVPALLATRVAPSATATAADFTFTFRQHLRKAADPFIPVIYELIEGGDFNGDGRRDLVSFQNDNQIELLLQRADGTFSSPLLFSRGSYVYTAWPHFVVADFNGDRIDDLAFNVVNEWGSQGGVAMLLSRRGLAPVLRSVSPTGLFTSGSAPTNWVALDVNSDRNTDLLVFHNSWEDFNPTTCEFSPVEFVFCPHFNVQYGDGKGNLTAPEPLHVAVPEMVREVMVEDVDGDALNDVVFVGSGSDQVPASVTYARKLPHGGFAQPAGLHKTVTEDAIFFSDINGDGRRDSIKGAEIHLRREDGRFGSRLWLYTYISTSIQPALGDFDGDGLTDLVNNQFETFGTIGFFALYLQRGGTLSAPVRFYHPQFAQLLKMDYHHPKVYAIGDFNGDRCRDIAVAANYDGIVFLEGKNCIPIPLRRTGGNLRPAKRSP